jgi:hypothetical protein
VALLAACPGASAPVAASALTAWEAAASSALGGDPADGALSGPALDALLAATAALEATLLAAESLARRLPGAPGAAAAALAAAARAGGGAVPRRDRAAVDALLTAAAAAADDRDEPPPSVPALVPGWGPPLRAEWCVRAEPVMGAARAAPTPPPAWRRGCRLYAAWSPADGARLATVVQPEGDGGDEGEEWGDGAW